MGMRDFCGKRASLMLGIRMALDIRLERHYAFGKTVEVVEISNCGISFETKLSSSI